MTYYPTIPDAELSLIGAVLLNDACYDIVRAEGVRTEHFASGVHRRLWNAIVTAADAGLDIDTVTLLDKLGPDDARIAMDSIETCPACSHVTTYARIVMARAARRAMTEHTREALALLTADADIAEARTMLDAALDGSIAHATGRSRNLRDLLRDDVGMKPVKGLDWGLARLDRDVGAIPEAALTILGASPGVGKTSLALTVLLHLATAGVPVLIFSLEMSEAQLMHTLAARGARVSAGRLRRLGYCGLHPDERARMEGWMAALYDKASPCLYVETRHNRIAEIAAHARRMQRQHGIVLVVVDYLQLISREPGEESRRLGIDATVNALKRLAKDSGLSVMLLSQLSRSPTNEPPTMSRLKESGGIEEAADMILLLHRPQFRQWDTCQDCGGAQVANCQRCHGDGQVSRDTRLDVHVEKNKFGPAGFACKFTWDGPYMTISEWRESDAER